MDTERSVNKLFPVNEFVSVLVYIKIKIFISNVIPISKPLTTNECWNQNIFPKYLCS